MKKKVIFCTNCPDTYILQFMVMHLYELGSFTGGALASWFDIYGIVKADGIDVNPMYAAAGNRVAKQLNLLV